MPPRLRRHSRVPASTRESRLLRRLLSLAIAPAAVFVGGCTTGEDSSDTVKAKTRSETPTSATSGRTVVLRDEPFICAKYPQPLSLDLVSVTLRSSKSDIRDAIWLSGEECSGFIRRVEVDTWLADGIKIGGQTHDLTIGGGVIRCHDRGQGAHQDGIHVMGGESITLRNIEVDCPTSNHSAFYVNQAGRATTPPSEVVCENCVLRATSTTVHIANSERSGVRGSTIYSGEFFDGVRICDCAVDPVNENTVIDP